MKPAPLALALSLGLASAAAAQAPAAAPAVRAVTAANSAVPQDLLEPTAQQIADVDAPDSTIGLYLAASSAIDDGRSDEAAELFARAADMAEGDARDQMRGQAFLAFVQAGNIEMAARYAPPQGDDADGLQRLGVLVNAINDMAKGDFAAADALLGSGGTGPEYQSIVSVVRPWAAAGLGDADKAMQGVPMRPNATEALVSQYNRALLLEFLGRTDGLDELYASLTTRSANTDFAFSYGAFLERQGRKPEAVKIYQALLEKFPDDVKATRALERAKNRRGAAPPAITPAQGASQALISGSLLELARGDAESAAAYLWLALRLDGSRTDALWMAASLEQNLGRTALARKHLEMVPADAPEYVSARLTLADLAADEGNVDEALAISRQTVALSPRDEGVKMRLASALNAAGRHDEAITLISRIIRDRGRDADWSLYYARAVSYNQTNDWPNVERDLVKALELEPTQPAVMNYLGYSWADRGQNLPQALSLLQQAVRASPDNGAVIDSLGWAYFRMGDMDRAVQSLERAVVLEPGDATVNDHLGDAYLGVGRKLEAVYQWQRVLTLHPDDEMRAKVESKITAHGGVVPVRPATVASADEPARR